MNSEKTPFSKQKKSAQKKAGGTQEKEKQAKRKSRSEGEDSAQKEKSSKKKLNFGNTLNIDTQQEDLGVRQLPGTSTSGPSTNLRSKRRLRFNENETKSYNNENKKLRQQYREKIGPNWRYFVRCMSDSSDEDSIPRCSLPPGASGSYIRYHLVNNGSDIVGLREYY